MCQQEDLRKEKRRENGNSWAKNGNLTSKSQHTDLFRAVSYAWAGYAIAAHRRKPSSSSPGNCVLLKKKKKIAAENNVSLLLRLPPAILAEHNRLISECATKKIAWWISEFTHSIDRSAIQKWVNVNVQPSRAQLNRQFNWWIRFPNQ